MKTTVRVLKDIKEDLSMNWFAFRKGRITRVWSEFEMEFPNGCSSPLQKGYSIRLNPKKDSICIDEYSNIEYDATFKIWRIWLATPLASASSFDDTVAQQMNQYGFDKITVIVPKESAGGSK